MAGPEIVARLGLNKERYSQGLKDAQKDFHEFAHETGREGGGVAEQLKHSFHGVHEVLKAFGAVAVFKEFIEGFKALSEYADKFGDKTDQNIRAAVRWGEAWKDSGNAVKGTLAGVLGYLTRAGEYVGGKLKGESLNDVDKDQAGEDAANAAESRLAAYKKKNDPEKMKQLRKEIADQEKATARETMTDQEKITDLYKDQVALINERAHLSEDETEKDLELQQKSATITHQIADLEKKMADEKSEAAKRELEHEEELHKKKLDHLKELATEEANAKAAVGKIQGEIDTKTGDRSKMTVGELASMDTFAPGVSVELGQQGAQAREALAHQTEGNRLRKEGNFADSMTEFSFADKIIGSLSGPGGPLRSTENPMSGLEDRMAAAVDHLEKIESHTAAMDPNVSP